MEVKDVNTQNNPLALLKKNNAAVSALDFSSLVASKKQDFGLASIDFSGPNAVTLADKSADTKLSDSARPAESTASDVVESKPRKDNKRKDDVKEDVVSTPTQTEPRTASEPVEAPAAAEAPRQVSEDAPTMENTDAELAPQTADISNAPEAKVNMPAESPRQNLPTQLTAADVKNLGEIMYFDAKSNNFVATTGAELAAAMESGEISTVNLADITDMEGNPVSLEKMTALSTAAEDGIDISELTMVSPEEVAAPQAVGEENVELVSKENIAAAKKAVSSGQEDNTTELLEDAKGEVEAEIQVAEDKKVKLDVTIKNNEEKISYRSRQDMVANSLSLQETAESSVDSPKSLHTAQVSPTAAAGSNTTSPNVSFPQGTAVPQAAVIQTMVENVSTAASQGNSAVVDGVVVATSTVGNGAARQAQGLPRTEMKSPLEESLKGMSREVIDQVKVNITKSAVKGVDKIDISLKPEDLGHIEIKMQLSKDGKLHAHIIASRPETMEILQKDMQILQKAFADAGFQTDDNSLSFAYNDNSQAWQQQREEENGLRQFMGNIFEQDSGNDNLPLSEIAWDGKSALNIRV